MKQRHSADTFVALVSFACACASAESQGKLRLFRVLFHSIFITKHINRAYKKNPKLGIEIKELRFDYTTRYTTDAAFSLYARLGVRRVRFEEERLTCTLLASKRGRNESQKSRIPHRKSAIGGYCFVSWSFLIIFYFLVPIKVRL